MNVGSSAPRGAVFLSYASQDKEVAKRICDALRAAGVEVWFDQSELRGGDAWDAMIRKRIKECALFVPVITPHTNARAEGYFRLEWKLAVDRSHLMADDAPFLFPIVVGDLDDATARVPDKFRDVQWTRLRLDETPAELGARVARLLSDGSNVGGTLRPDSSRESGYKTPPSKTARWRWWMIFPVLGTIMGLLFAAVPIWKSLNRPPRPQTQTPDPQSQTPKAKLSEARQLAERVRDMTYKKYDSVAADYAAAEGLVQKATALDPNDAEIWAIASLFHTSIRTRGFDSAPGRREQARAAADRALKLAPDSVNALFALGRAQRDSDRVAAEATFRRILTLDPRHAEAMSQLAWLYEGSDRPDEAAVLYDRVLELDPQGAPLTHYVRYLMFFHYGRFAEAEAAINQSVALKPSANSVTGQAMVALTWRGDAEAAARALAAAPAGLREETRMIWVSALVHLARHDPEEVLSTLARTESTYIQDNWFAAPKALLAGLAHRQAGRHEAARVAWESALAVTDARLKEAPSNAFLHMARGQLLAWLDRPDEARREARTLDELRGDGYAASWFQSSVLIHAALGDADAAVPRLERMLAWKQGTNTGWPLTVALLRTDVRWDPIRGDPRFQKLITDAGAREIAAHPLRNWPKDPDLKRAFTIITSIDATAESCRLAEDMVNAVLRQRPTDVEATVVYATLNNYYMNRGYDASTEREVLARRYAERALQLAPDEPEALAAMAQFLGFRQTDFPRAEQLIRRAMDLAPHEPRFARILSYNILRVTRPADALAQARENAVRFPHDALTQYDLALIARSTGDVALMEEALDRTIALAPIGSAMVWKGWLTGWLHGDLPGFKSWLDRISGNFRFNERAVFMRYVYACLTGDAAYGMEAVRSFTGTWMNDYYYVGPRSLLLGDLLALEGKAGLAREQYERALAEIRRVAAAQPDDTQWRSAEFWTLLALGRNTEARQSAQRQLDALRRPYRPVYNVWWHNPITVQLLAGDRAGALALIREAAAVPIVREQIRTALRIDPRMAPFRDDPEIKVILAEPEKK